MIIFKNALGSHYRRRTHTSTKPIRRAQGRGLQGRRSADVNLLAPKLTFVARLHVHHIAYLGSVIEGGSYGVP